MSMKRVVCFEESDFNNVLLCNSTIFTLHKIIIIAAATATTTTATTRFICKLWPNNLVVYPDLRWGSVSAVKASDTTGPGGSRM